MKLCKCKSYFRKLIQYCRGTVSVVGEQHLWKLSVELWCKDGCLVHTYLDIKFYGVNYYFRTLGILLLFLFNLLKSVKLKIMKTMHFSMYHIYGWSKTQSAARLIENKQINDKILIHFTVGSILVRLFCSQ